MKEQKTNEKVLSILSALSLLIFTVILPVSATQEASRITETIHTEYGDITVETTLVIHNSYLRSSTKSASKTQSLKYGGVEIGKVTLSATFGYDGKTAWVEDMDSSHSTSGSWSYGSEKISTSGGTATLTAKLTNLFDGTIPVNISMTCTPSGSIS